MKKQFLETGQIVSTHGIHGEVRVNPWCSGGEFLTQFKTLYLDNGKTPLPVENARLHKNIVIIKFAGYENMDQALTLRGKVLYINRNDAVMGENEYFVQDLIGLTVIDQDTKKIYGTITDVSETGANDVYHIRAEDGKMFYIPAIKQVIYKTDMQAEKMWITPMKGLFDDED